MKVHLLLPEGRETPAGIPAMSRDALRRDLDLRTAVLGIAGRDDVIYDTLMEQLFTPLLEREGLSCVSTCVCSISFVYFLL